MSDGWMSRCPYCGAPATFVGVFGSSRVRAYLCRECGGRSRMGTVRLLAGVLLAAIANGVLAVVLEPRPPASFAYFLVGGLSVIGLFCYFGGELKRVAPPPEPREPGAP